MMTHRMVRAAVLACLALPCAQGAVAEEVSLADDIEAQAQRLGEDIPAQLVRGSFESAKLEHVVEYAVLLPDGYRTTGTRYPLVLLLHAATLDREHLALRRPQIERLWLQNEMPRFVVATFSAGLSFYIDDLQGNAKWESFIMEELLPFVRDRYFVSSEREYTIVTGMSMGGFGAGMLAFRHPEEFGAVAMMEPALWPAVRWDDLEPYQNFLRPEKSGTVFGAPVNDDYWAAHNPASIVAANPGRIRDAGLAIYLECGDEDAFGFHEGAEVLHRLLWDHGIRHEYRLVRGADHVGATLLARSRDRFLFIARYLEPGQPVPAVEVFRKKREDAYRELGYEPFPFWPYEPHRLELQRRANPQGARR